LLSGKPAAFVLVFMSGVARARDGNAKEPRSASAMNSDAQGLEGDLRFVFKESWT